MALARMLGGLLATAGQGTRGRLGQAIGAIRLARKSGRAKLGALVKPPAPAPPKTKTKAQVITPAQWVANVLPDELRAAWNRPDGLLELILGGLQLKVGPHLLPAARRLRELEPKSARAQSALAAVLLSSGQRAEARQVLEECLGAHPDDASAWLNLSRLHEQEGRSAEAITSARRALDLLPGEIELFTWWQSLVQLKDPAQLHSALEALATHPNGWLARVALAEESLASGSGPEGLKALERVCAAAAENAAILVYIAHRLVGLDRLADLSATFGSRWEAALVDGQVALWLAQSRIARGDLEGARQVTHALRTRNAPSKVIAAVSSAIALAARKEPVPASEVRGVPLTGPIWFEALGRPEWLRSRAPSKIRTVVLLAWSVAEETLLDDPLAGAISRGIPLALTEALWARTDAAPVTVLPVALGKGVIRWTQSPTPNRVPGFAPKQAGPETLLISGHVSRLKQGGVEVALMLIALDGSVRETLRLSAADAPELAAQAERALIEALTRHRVLARWTEPLSLLPKPEQRSVEYLMACEGVAIQVLTAARLLPSDSVWNDALAWRGYLEVIEQLPKPDAPRLLAAAGLVAGIRYRPSQWRPHQEALRKLLSSRVTLPLQLLVSLAAGDLAAFEAANKAQRLLPAQRAWLERVQYSVP